VAAADLANGTVALLAQRPPILVHDLVTVAGTTYVTGQNRSSKRPAVAWTRDRGRSWQSNTFTDVAACDSQQCSEPRIASADGISAYAELHQPYTDRRLTYHTDGAGWTPVNTSNNVPHAGGGVPAPWIAPDGTYVIVEVTHDRAASRDEVRFWALRGQTFVPTVLHGLPSTVHSVTRTPDGWYFTVSYPDQVLYGSTDGWSWTPVIP
jgi:hypothetical protein